MPTMPISMNIIRQMWLTNFALFDQLEDFVASQLVKTDLPPENPECAYNHYTKVSREQMDNLIAACVMYATRQDDAHDEHDNPVLVTGEMEELQQILTLPIEQQWKALANSITFSNAFGPLEYVNDSELMYWAGEY